MTTHAPRRAASPTRRSGPSPRSEAPAPRAAVVAVVALFAVSIAVQLTLASSGVGSVFSLLTPWIPVVACAAAAARTHGEVRTGWMLVGAGMGCNGVGDAIFVLITQLTGAAPELSSADVFYLATYPFLLAGVAVLVRAAAGRRAHEAALDAATVALVIGLVIWQFLVVNPGVASEGPLTQRIAFSLYPMADALIVAVLCAVLLLPEGRSLTLALVGVFAAGLVGADVTYNVIAITGADGLLGVSNALYDVCYLLLTLAAMTAIGGRGGARSFSERRVNTARLALLGLAMVCAPLLAITASSLGFDVHTPLYIACALAVSALVMVRLITLVRGLDDERARLRRTQRELAHRAAHDSLTGLPNRAFLLGELRRAMDDAQQGETRTEVHLLFVDLDDFKFVNDSLGHRAGDELLRAAGDRIRSVARADDVVARLGGDEFVILRERGDGDDALRLADSLLRDLSRPLTLNGEDAFVGASVGIARLDDQADPAELLRDADLAMYEAKAAGKGQVQLFDAYMRERAAERHGIEQGLRRALDRGTGLWLAYQPRVDLRTGETLGMEALARWTDEDGVIYQPDAFIPVAERSGLIGRLGAWALERAATDLVALNATRPGERPLRVSVNLSVREVDTPGLAERVERTLTQAGLDPSLLTLEITESLLARDAGSAAAVLGRLRALGVRVEVDDFGVGYSSLSRLGGFPLDGVKIDRGFVAGIAERATARSVVVATIALAGALGLEVTAEGVETDEQAAWLIEHGCTGGQGFLFAAPSPLADLRDRLLATGPLSSR